MSSNSSPASARQVTLPVAVAIVVANMVGTGVFGSLGFQVAELPSGFPVMLLWGLGGVISFCGAVCYAELASMMPRSGGEYHLLREAWHPAVGFLSGWVSATVGFAAPIALNAVLLGKYLAAVFAVPGWDWAFSVPVVVGVTAVHLGSLSRIGQFQMFFTGLKIFLILVLAGAAFALGAKQEVSFLPQPGDLNLIKKPAFAISLVYVLYAYAGWNAAAYITGELKKPQRTLPLALLIGTAIVTSLYVLLNAAFLYATPIESMAGVPEVGHVAAREIFGERGGAVMGLLISIGLISTISSMTWAGPRVTAMMGEDYRLFSWLARRNGFGVPAWAVLLQAVFVLVLVVTASFEQLIQYIQAILTLSSLLTVLAVLWLRFRMPGAPRPYRALGYPVTPLVFVLMSGYVLFFQVRERPVETGWGMVTLLIGLLVYLASLLFQRRKKRTDLGGIMNGEEEEHAFPDLPGALMRSATLLQNLAQAGNLDRLESEARRFLEEDPDDLDARYYLALGLTDQGRYREAKPHVDFLLNSAPESTETLFAEVHWYASQERWRQARPHIAEGMRIDPDDPIFYRYAAIDHASRLKIEEAKGYIAQARELAPDDPDIANLYIRIHGALETSMEDAFKRLHDYEDALKLDPQSAELHNRIGDVYLDEIDDPVMAESQYREAVRFSPADRTYQQDLSQAVAKRSLVYRIFSLPSRTFTWLGHLGYAIRLQPWRILFLLIGFKFVIGFSLWLLAVTIVFWPGGKVYEWLLVSEINRGAGASLGKLRAWHRIRFSLFFGANLAIWGGLFALMGIPLALGYSFVAIFAGIHFALVTILWSIRRMNASWARGKIERRKNPPPLPKRAAD